MFGILAAALMATSFFLPWAEFFGNEIGPMMLLDPPGGAEINLNWRSIVFLASFAIAALAAVLALVQRAAGLLMLIAGAIPFALVAEQVFGARAQLDDLGLPVPRGGDPMEAFDLMREFVSIGLPAYVISAALLVVIGLFRLARGR